MSALELRIPPVALVLIAAACMWLVAMLGPSNDFAIAFSTPIAAVITLAGTLVALLGVMAFRAAHTTVNPTTPNASSSIVASGIYRISRNPMYLGFLLMLAGWAVYLSNTFSCIFLPLFVLYMNRFQIRPEERALEAKFGAQYVAYKQQVRRWL